MPVEGVDEDATAAMPITAAVLASRNPPVISVPDESTQARELLFATQRWVERADAKASMLLAGITAGFFVLLAFMSQLMPWASAGGVARGSVEVLLAAAVASLVAGALLAGRAIFPRLGPDYEHVEGVFGPGDLAYFGRLRKIPAREIVVGMHEALERGEFTLHFAEQLRESSAVAWEKHRHVQRAMVAIIPAVGLALLAVVLWTSMRLAS